MCHQKIWRSNTDTRSLPVCLPVVNTHTGHISPVRVNIFVDFFLKKNLLKKKLLSSLTLSDKWLPEMGKGCKAGVCSCHSQSPVGIGSVLGGL